MYDILSLNEKKLPELKEIAKELKIKGINSLKKQDLVYKILDEQAINPPAKAVIKKTPAKKKPVAKKETSEKKVVAKKEKAVKSTEEKKEEAEQEAPRKPRPRKEVMAEKAARDAAAAWAFNRIAAKVRLHHQ